MNPERKPEKPDRLWTENRIRGLAKSMRNVNDLEKEYKKDRNLLTQDEKRLLDLITFHKTGKHIDEFKEPKKPKPKTTGNRLRLLKTDPLDPNIVPDKKQKEIIAKRVALKASESVS